MPKTKPLTKEEVRLILTEVEYIANEKRYDNECAAERGDGPNWDKRQLRTFERAVAKLRTMYESLP